MIHQEMDLGREFFTRELIELLAGLTQVGPARDMDHDHVLALRDLQPFDEVLDMQRDKTSSLSLLTESAAILAAHDEADRAHLRAFGE